MSTISTALKNMPAWLQCDGKERYESASLAQKVVKRRMLVRKLRNRKGASRPLRAYRCCHCSGWHIGGYGG